MNDVEIRIRDALRAAAEEVREQDLRPAAAVRGTHTSRRTTRWVAPVLAAAAVAAVVVTSLVLSGSRQPAHRVQPGTVSTPASSGTGTNVAPTPASTTVQASRATPAPGVGACFFADACAAKRASYYEPLWPFGSYSEARQWETVDGPNGHSPWHLDARTTASSFTQHYLGFADVDMVTSAVVGSDEARVGVGYRDANGGEHTAAVLHLVRYERDLGDTAAGWEVVGSDDTTLSIERPVYATAVSSPMTVGGHITGVDESITVTVRTLAGRVDAAEPLPAGGTNTPWSEAVAFSGRGVLTVAAVTGGHLVQHERFSIQGVHTTG